MASTDLLCGFVLGTLQAVGFAQNKRVAADNWSIV
jgi:hypothetical protein